MEAYSYHVYICNQQKPEGVPSCSAHGSTKLIDTLRVALNKAGLSESVQVTPCGSIGLCERGPNMVVYPDGVWYSGVKAEDVPEIVDRHFRSGEVVERLVNRDPEALRAEIDSNKGKMLAARRANDEAGALPDELMQQVRAFQVSRVILSAVELDIFTAVGRTASAAEVARRRNLDSRATEMLLNALVAIGLVTKQDDQFCNSEASARFLTATGRDDSRASLMHTVHLWDRWSTLSECVRTGTSVTYRDFPDRGREWTEAFIAAMHKNARPRAPQVVRAIGVDDAHRILDVGGGSGAYAIAFGQANPRARVEVFDLPTVIPLAQSHIDEAGLADRVTTRAGDFHTDDLGTGFDLVFLSAICHMNSPEENLALLKKCFEALEPGGRIVIQDFVLKPDKTAPTSAALFALNMLVGTRGGSSYSEVEYKAWLEETAFRNVRLIRLPGPTALAIGQRA